MYMYLCMRVFVCVRNETKITSDSYFRITIWCSLAMGLPWLQGSWLLCTVTCMRDGKGMNSDLDV